MTLWSYLALNKDIYGSTGGTSDEEYTVYAITNNKDIAMEFEKTRNMGIFIRTKHPIEKEEYAEYVNNMARTALLEKTQLITKKMDPETGKYVADTVELVLTSTEAIEVEDASVAIFDIWFAGEDSIDMSLLESRRSFNTGALSDIFSSKLRKSLNILMFDYIMGSTYEEFSNNMTYSAPDIEVDQLECFIELYGHLLK